jgi:hypothetical protein
MAFVELQRIVAAVEEFDLGAEQFCGAFGLVFAAAFYFSNVAPVLSEQTGSLPFAIGHADDFDPISAFGMQGDRSAGTPNEIAGMGRDDEPGLLIRHATTPFTYRLVKLG